MLKGNSAVDLFYIAVAFAMMLLFIAAVNTSHAQRPIPDEGKAENGKHTDKINDVGNIIYAWANAWKQKDLETYKSFYSPQFQSKNYSYAQWMKKKSKLFRKRDVISIEIFYLGIFIKNNHAYVSFIQKYKDPRHADVGEKNMVLVQSNGTWKIVSEEWQPLAGKPP